MQNIAFLFPGQGSQFIKMGKALYDNFIEAKEVFDEVDNVLNRKLSKLIFDGSNEELILTANTQPAIMATSMAAFRILLSEFSKSPKLQFINHLIDNRNIAENWNHNNNGRVYMAGHSLGEYTALCAARYISLHDTTQLLKIRGNAMQSASRGSMIALLDTNIEDANEIARLAVEATKNVNDIDDLEKKTCEICEVANDNGAGQFILSGTELAISKAVIISENYGIKKVKLSVSSPFHSSLMKDASNEMITPLTNVSMTMSDVSIIANYTAQPYLSINEIKKSLVHQITSTVRWRETINKLLGENVDIFVEVGPGKVLSTLLKRQYASYCISRIPLNNKVEILEIHNEQQRSKSQIEKQIDIEQKSSDNIKKKITIFNLHYPEEIEHFIRFMNDL